MSDPGSKSSFNYPSDNQGKGNESIDSNNQSNSRPNESGPSSSGSSNNSSNNSNENGTSRDLYENLNR